MKISRFFGASALVSTLCLVAPVFAQDASPPAKSDVAADAPTDKEIGDQILVVGSRIRRDTFNSVSPIQVITREETTLAGFASTTAALQGTGVTGGSSQINNSYGGFVTDGGPGANTLSLRGLGATRTLILLNGRRIAPSGTRGSVGSADLNVLPNAITDRIDILRDGASSVYGSDAVAGVVNIVTRKKIEGLTLEGQYNATGEGGGNAGSLSAVIGTTGDRFNIAAAFEYSRRNELTLGDRDWSRCNTDYRINPAIGTPGSGDFIDPRTGQPKCYPITTTGSNGVTINTIGTNTRPGVAAPGTTGTNFNRFRPNSAVTTGLIGFEGVSLNSRDTFDPRTLNRQSISPGEVYNGYIQGGYDIQTLGDAEVYFEFLANIRKSSQVGYRQLSLDYAVGSPLIPANLSTSVFSAPQVPNLTGTKNIGVRAFIGFGNDEGSQNSKFWKASVGMRGDFLFDGWRYDAYLSSSWADASYTFQSFLTDRLAKSLDVVAAGSGFACRDTSDGCVAAPALTTATIGGQLPKAWTDYVFVPVTGTTQYREKVASFGVDGALFELPYGKVQAAFGLEYRSNSIDDTPPADSRSGNLFNLTSAAVTRGKDSVWEAYGEVEVPLLANLPIIEELTLNVSGRYTRYKSYGGDYTYKVGGVYRPFNWLSLRATYGTSYRAPALFEQFLGSTSGFLSATGDPCNNYDQLPADSQRRINCASEGLPAGFLATSGIQVNSIGGAAAGLAAETSTNLTVGMVFQPKLSSSFGDFSFAVDYYKIKVDNGVARAGAGNILALCYDDQQFRAGGSFCRLIAARDPGSNRLVVDNSYINLATDIVRGIDYTMRYSREIGPGTLRLNAAVTQYLEQSNKLFVDDALDDLNGTISNPAFTGDFSVNYTYKDWRLRYGVEWIDGVSDYKFYVDNSATSVFAIKDYFLHAVSVRYQPDKWGFTLGVRNLTDRDPPQISSGRYNRIGNAALYSGYDYQGRTFFLNVTKEF